MLSTFMRWLAAALVFVGFTSAAIADTPALLVYSDAPGAGWSDNSWSSTVNMLDTPAHSGSNGVAATIGKWAALCFFHSSMSTAPYSAVSFWINGGTSGGQLFSLTLYNASNVIGSYALPALAANQWTYVTVPLINIGAENTQIDSIAIQDRSGSAQAQIYVDDVTLVPKNALVIYSDALSSGWYDYSWSTTNSESSTTTVHSGTKAASVAINAGYGGFNLVSNTSMSTSAYDQVSFWINGGPSGNQTLSLQLHYQGNSLGAVSLPPIPANTWVKMSVAMSSLSATNATIDSFVLQDISGNGASLFYVDDISFDFAHTPSSLDLVPYDEALGNGWQNWSWNQSVNFSNTTPVYSGSYSAAVTVVQAGQGLALHHNFYGTGLFDSISFMINGGNAGGHNLKLYAQMADGSLTASVMLPTLVSNAWTHVIVPLNALGISDAANTENLVIADNSATSSGSTFYIDAVNIYARTAPVAANISVNAGSTIKTIDTRTAGINQGAYDYELGTSSENSVLAMVAPGSIRYPGGSLADAYHWSTNTVDGSSTPQYSGLAKFAAQNETMGSKAYLTVNYGSGTPEEASALVAWANGSTSSSTSLGTDVNGKNWKTVGYWASLRAAAPLSKDDGFNVIRANHSAAYGWKYFEIGNEVFGPWENDTHGASGSKLTGTAHDAPTYASNAATFITKMKTVDSTIMVGVVATLGGLSGSNGGSADDFCYAACPSSQAVPSAAGGSHAGWNPVVLYRMAKAGVRPDFLILHDYPQEPGYESDEILLGESRLISNWSVIAQSQIANYWTGSNGSSIDLAVTEANSVSGNDGKQTANLVNALYYSDFFGQLSHSGFNAAQWWSLRGQESTAGNNSSSLYGSRNYGTYSLVSDGQSPSGVTVPADYAPFPTYRTFKQLVPWRASGASVVATGSSDPNLTAYANKRTDGKLAILVVNKSPTQSITATLNLAGYTPSSTAVTVTTYGINEDNANSDMTSSSVSSGTAISYTFAPYSSTLLMYTSQ